MMPVTWRLAWRLARGQAGRVWLLIACIALGVSARVCVGSFSSAFADALAREARPLLGADLEIASNQALTADEEREFTAAMPTDSLVSAQMRFTTMGLAPGSNAARPVEVRAVERGFPLYGTVRVAPGTLDDLYGGEAVVFVQRELLAQLSVVVGGTLKLGTTIFRIAGVIEEEPGLGANPFSMGPRVLIDRARVAATGLAGSGARVRHARLVSVAPDQVDTVAAALRATWKLPDRTPTGFGGRIEHPRGLSVRTAAQASESTARVFERVGDFLRLVALSALLLGGIGVASLVRGFITEHLDAVATLQVLGATPTRVAAVFLIQAAGLGLLGGVLGAVAGAGIENLLLFALNGHLPVMVEMGVDLRSLLWGVGLGGATATVFAALPLAEVRGMRPLAILRGDSAATRSRWPVLLLSLLIIGLAWLLAVIEAHSYVSGSIMIVALVFGAGITAGLGWLALRVPVRLVRGLSGRLGVGLRHGLGNLTRPGFRPLAAVVAIAAAAQLLGTMATYHASLGQELDPARREDLPGHFVIDVQADQVAAFSAWTLLGYGVEPQLSPMVRGRLRSVNGTSSKTGSGTTREAEGRQFMRSREQNLSWRDKLGADETIIAGKWMSDDPQRVEASLERRFAADIGAKLGDRVVFDVQGVDVEATVTSLRAVRWAGMKPNFFVLLSPHALRDAPQVWVAAVPRLPVAHRARFAADLTAGFPGVTVFDVGEAGERLSMVVENISMAVRFLGWFCLVAGLLVLAGIGLSTARARRADAALLNVLGGTRGTLFASLCAEFGCLGLVAGVVGLGLGVFQAWIMLVLLLDLRLLVPWSEMALLLVGIVVIGALAGLAACRQVFHLRPLVVLREE